MTLMMIRTLIPLHRKAFTLLVQPRFGEKGTLRTAKETFLVSTSDRNLSSYRERLRSGIVDIKKDDAVDLFESMLRSRPLPTIIDFSRLFGGIARTKQYDLVLALSKQMEMEGIAHNIYTLNIMINCFCRSRKLCFALEIFEKLQKSKMELGTSIYSIIIHGMCNASKVDDAWDLFCSLPLKGVKTDIQAYNIMMSGLCKKGSLSEADRLFRKMKEDAYNPDGCTYNTLIRAHLRDSNATTSVQLIEEMKR